MLQRAVVHGTSARCTFVGEGYSATGAGCQLRFTLQPTAVVVQTGAGQAACGFGNGVSADNTYRRVKAGVPLGFQDGTGNWIPFKGLHPEQYNAD